MFKTVYGFQLKGNIKGAEDDDFYGAHGKLTEDEYRQLLTDSQEYFEGIDNGTIDKESNYFIHAPESHLEHDKAYDIAAVTKDRTDCVDARWIYIKNPIKVIRIEDGYMYKGSDGRHRYAVAQKYNLRLLVEISEDVE